MRTATSWHWGMGAGAADRGMQGGSLGGRGRGAALGGALCQPGGFGARGRVPTTIQSGAASFTSADVFGGGGVVLPARWHVVAVGGFGGVQSRRCRRLVRNAAGRSMWSGHAHPRWRISALRASVIWRAVQAAGSMLAAVIASQMAPMCP